MIKNKIDQPNSTKKLQIPQISLIELFRKTASSHKEKNALYFKGKYKTYEALEEEINRFSNSLQNLGVKKGDRIAVLLPNCPQFYTIFFAAQSIGAIFTSFNPMYSSREIAQRLKDSEAKIFVTLNIFLDKIKPIEHEIPAKHIVVTSVARELPASKKYIYKLITARKNISLDKSIDYEKLIQDGENRACDIKINPKTDVAILQYTGGTTGEPKGAMLTHRNLISQATVLQYWKNSLEKLPEGQFHVAGVLPYSHIFGLTSSFLWPISEGATTYLVPDPRKLEEIMILIEKQKIHFLYCVPIFFKKFASHPLCQKYNLSSLHLCVSGGESLPNDTVQLFEEKTNCLLIEGYGLTEASPVSHINPPNKSGRKIGSIGIPIPNTIAKIMDTKTNKEITTVDTPGELWIKGPGIMKGYWNNPKATKEALEEDWLRTGDIAMKTSTGYYSIIDRIKDIIIVSGYNVWPNEVEEILSSHPNILEAAVIPHETELGVKIKAILVSKPGLHVPTLEEIRAFCKESLAPYKIPFLIEYREELPRSMVGKVLRSKLRAEPIPAV